MSQYLTISLKLLDFTHNNHSCPILLTCRCTEFSIWLHLRIVYDCTHQGLINYRICTRERPQVSGGGEETRRVTMSVFRGRLLVLRRAKSKLSESRSAALKWSRKSLSLAGLKVKRSTWSRTLKWEMSKCGRLVVMQGATVRPHPGPLLPPAAWRASPAPRGVPSRCGRRSPGCASSSRSTACAGSAALSSPPPTRRRGHPANVHTQERPELKPRGRTSYYYHGTCLLAKMSNRASRSSFSVSSLANSLWASMSLSLWQLSITNTTAGNTPQSFYSQVWKRSVFPPRDDR